MGDLICDCGHRLVWLVCESRASPTLARQLWRCTSCERFRWNFEHPPWPDGLLDGMLTVAPFREFLREQQAEIARNAYAALANAGESRPLILTGDLNDTVQAATTQLLLGPPGSEIGTGGFDQSDQGDHRRLWNLAL